MTNNNIAIKETSNRWEQFIPRRSILNHFIGDSMNESIPTRSFIRDWLNQ